ncbi:VCBS repeat-containing protein [Crocinitomix algicola]|uniref:VCBS repeat-containing protein n=1 Tax=Crocinitomix algicola TaxID=1740263 RepID=UPI000834EAD3|nr:VCBS repeat-containing protein [Crocinitomix algicola]
MNLTKATALMGLCYLVFSCINKQHKLEIPQENQVEFEMSFEQVSPSHSGIDFINSIQENDEFNYYKYEDIYSGGGVATGDVNNDGLIDIYFTGNHVSDKLYLNQGEMVFEDVTDKAFDYDLAKGWHTAVNMVDINADGWLDIFVCRSGKLNQRALFSNLLFINNQDGTFTEQAEAYGLALKKRTMNAAFFDYDNDGDLDLYMLNHPHQYEEGLFSGQELRSLKTVGPDADMFLENQNGLFVDVSEKVGVRNNMYGLGIGVADIDGNGYLDVYVSNDYEDPDLLYMNNGDGTFTEEAKKRFKHFSNFSMGNDIADINNDGFLDVVTLDMAAEDHVRSKRNMGGMSTSYFWQIVDVGFHYQFMFNCLQLNNGNGTFSDIGQMAGISKTDWSWAPLIADFDNDGFKDLFVTNGFKRDVRDNDYNNQYFKKKQSGGIEDLQQELALIPATKIENYMFRNNGNLTFEKATKDWGLDVPINSNGAAYADLDNDGDLDLIVNNMEEESLIFENKLQGNSNNYLRVKIDGYKDNSLGLGTKVWVYTDDGRLYQEFQISRGFISSVEPYLHFGLGDSKVNKVVAKWLDGTVVEVSHPKPNSILNLKYQQGKIKSITQSKHEMLFKDITDSLLSHKHVEVPFNDFETEVLLPNKLSQAGPFITKGDVNGDGLEDIYISAPKGEKGRMLVQTNRGFVEKNGPWQKEVEREEMDALFFDADNDGDLDLYVVSGGNEYYFDSPFLVDQLYINDGKGNFKNESKRLPQIPIGGQTVAAADYDQDGDLDLFVGGRQVPGYYPYVPKSYLFKNEDGRFIDVTGSSPDVQGAGLVTDALFDDFDQDGDPDLIIVGEWMPISFYENNQGAFSNVTALYNSTQSVGWWYSIDKGDLNNDGKSDFVVGNLGENNKFHPTVEKPLEVYCHDFDGNGTNDIVLAKYQDKTCYPVRGRQCSSEQMPFIQKKFPTYSEFAAADLNKIYGEANLDKALHFTATSFSSVVLVSKNGKFEEKHLATECQMAPINRSVFADVNDDGNIDVITAGNNYAAEVETIRYDAGRGTVLLGDGSGGLKALAPTESGFFDNNDVKDMELVKMPNQTIVITVSNQGKAKTHRALKLVNSLTL